MELTQVWRDMLKEADIIISILPEDQLGHCVVTRDGELFKGAPEVLKEQLEAGEIFFQPDTIRGSWPRVKSPATNV